MVPLYSLMSLSALYDRDYVWDIANIGKEISLTLVDAQVFVCLMMTAGTNLEP